MRRSIRELIELEEAEREAISVLRRRCRIKNLSIELSDLKEGVYVIRGRFELVVRPGGLLRKEKVEERDFRILVDALTGKCVGVRI